MVKDKDIGLQFWLRGSFCNSSIFICQNMYLPINLNETERLDIIDLAKTNPSFYEVWKNKKDLTNVILKELRGVLHGKIKRNFIINIKGNIGRQTGIFKTSLGCQLALKLDPTFNVKERVGFTYHQLIEKIRTYAKRKQIFLLDERVRDFKQSGKNLLANIKDSCRESQLCFIGCGVSDEHDTFSDYHFERLGESNDIYLNKKIKIGNEEIITGEKTVYFLVRTIKENRRMYRGHIKWNITSLEDKKWRKFWEEYMILKRKHQQKAINSVLTGFNFKDESSKIRKTSEFKRCFDGDKLIRAKLKNLIYDMYPDNTRDERNMIYTEIIYSIVGK